MRGDSVRIYSSYVDLSVTDKTEIEEALRPQAIEFHSVLFSQLIIPKRYLQLRTDENIWTK